MVYHRGYTTSHHHQETIATSHTHPPYIIIFTVHILNFCCLWRELVIYLFQTGCFLSIGWIHAVLTPIDSLVFGGNFLHSQSVDLQIQYVPLKDMFSVNFFYSFVHSFIAFSYLLPCYYRCVEMEKRAKTPKKFLFPNLDTLYWYAMHHMSQEIRGK